MADRTSEAAAKLLADINGEGGEAAALAARNALTPAQRRAAIAAQNDALRRALGCSRAVVGRCVMSAAVAALDSDRMIRVMRAVQTFADFTPDNDPYGEHDFAALTVDALRINFKIDYYADAAMEFGAEDPLTSYRVLTIMLASDY
jgi:Protein of unknown function (DUF3768)